MAKKPRVQAPKQRSTTPAADSNQRRRVLMAAVGFLAALGIVLGGFALLGGSGGGLGADEAEAALAAGGCTLTVKPAVRNVSDHSDFADPAGTSPRWNTDPPTSGPHYGQTLIYGVYDEPVEVGRALHNLEHGAIFIYYGKDVPDSTVAQLETFYDAHKNGTILAPYPKLGDRIALGAWVADGLPEASSERGSGVLATCTKFDEAAFGAFFSAFQFKGPESGIIGPSNMRPGDQ